MSFEYWWAEEPRTTSEEALRHYFEECWGYAIEESAKLCESQIDLEYATGKVDHNEMAWCMKLAMDIRKLKAPNAELRGRPLADGPA